MTETKEKTPEETQQEFFKTLTWYFSEKTTPTGFFNTMGAIRDQLVDLNQKLEESSNASTKLASALNRLTLYGVLIALVTLAFNVCKYLYPVVGG